MFNHFYKQYLVLLTMAPRIAVVLVLLVCNRNTSTCTAVDYLCVVQYVQQQATLRTES